ncbi:RNA methyltransferase [Glaciimonas sp. Gout2]|uniref:RNA methyltransferase n=1 Tax=unclassified Glaciimonas TaxID=2644401 RepID=UPI002B236948|nr:MULTISPECIES: RNA methyltransferase [unclassified Glaciimonas]MEB0010681.1 RNA methyltransferase [Glaciimonas sp. Cout2]MEB0084827.1 RNA methyltransferase [Glaciimonas sp. Gout2]
MNLTKTNTSLFNRLRFVLVDTSSPGNVGAAARAIKTMGFSELVLVNPRYPDVLQRDEAIALASGAQDILSSARIVETVEQALIGCNYAAALSARLREFSPPVMAPRAVAAQLATDKTLTGAILFGSERYGLPNEIVEKCNVLINIPANPDYSSLNLSQAVQVLAYEFRVAASAEQPPGESESSDEIGFHGDTANLIEIEGMFAHLEKALIEIDFLDPAHPKKLMPRLKRLFARAGLETEEVNILRGIANQILTKRRRLD